MLYFSSLTSSLSSKSYNSAWQQHDGADRWYFGSIAQVSFTAVDFAFGDFHWGVVLFAVLRAAVRWLGTSFGKGFRCLAWDLTFYILFTTTVLSVRTGKLCHTVFAVIPALKRDTLVAFQGITWKKETNTKIELIAWISKAYTPNYPIVTIQYFCFSTRKSFGINGYWTFAHHLISSDKLFSGKNVRNVGQTWRELTQFSFVCVAKGVLKESGNI